MGEFYTVEQLVNDGPKYAMAYLLRSIDRNYLYVTYGEVNHYRLRPVASRLECNSRYCMMISSVTFPDVVEKYPRAQNRLPQ